MKHKRVWTDEARAAAAERMRGIQAKRWSKNPDEAAAQILTAVQEQAGIVVKDRDPEVQAVIESMTPERKAKLEAIQARQWQRDASEDKATREALERHEAQKNGITPLESKPEAVAVDLGPLPENRNVQIQEPPPPPKAVLVMEVPFKTPFRLTGSNSGMMISELSPCICGEQRLKWHPVCLKVKVNG
jgi:hypothetical protein